MLVKWKSYKNRDEYPYDLCLSQEVHQYITAEDWEEEKAHYRKYFPNFRCMSSNEKSTFYCYSTWVYDDYCEVWLEAFDKQEEE